MEIGLGLIYKLVSDLWRWITGKHRSLTPSEVVQLREKWQPIFDEKILVRNRDNLRDDVIVRDVKRVDIYPEIPEGEKGISAWFRVGLVSTYHRGIQVGLRIEGLCWGADNQRWREYDHAMEEPDINAYLLGLIRYENIESVQWDGDEFYGYPHIYCHFSEKGKQPYERLAYFERKKLDHFHYFTEITGYEDVLKRSLGTSAKGDT